MEESRGKRALVRLFPPVRFLKGAFGVHKGLNETIENAEAETLTADFFTVPKVDTHIHLAAAFPPSMIVDFVREKLEKHGDDEVQPNLKLSEAKRGGEPPAGKSRHKQSVAWGRLAESLSRLNSGSCI